MIVKVDKAKDLDWSRIQFFSPADFRDPEYSDSWELMDARAIVMLNWLCKHTEWPIVTHNKFGVKGCVCIDPEGHSPSSYHYVANGACAVDFHFLSEADPREQAREVIKSGFSGIGIYQNIWKWPSPDGGSMRLPIAFHVDRRSRFQIWCKKSTGYVYLLE